MKVTLNSKIHFDWSAYRERRNFLLRETDKYTISDFPISEENRALVLVYRQELRDMFDNVNTPEELVFPTWPLTES